jgi:hypothetical protein
MARDHDSDPASAEKQDPPKNPGKLGYKIFAGIGTAFGTAVARRALTVGWKQATGKEPPANPEHPDVRWAEAASWVVASAAVIAAAKLMAQRRVAATWRRASGTLPPGMDEPAR